MRKYVNEKFPHLLHGADYNPEQWIETKEIWDEDMKLMKDAHFNEASVGIFSWARLEPEEGKYDFSFLDEIIEKIYNNGGRVILATPSGSRPRWMAEKYEEVNRVGADGHRFLFTDRHNHCYTSPYYREKVRQINIELAKRYGNHPAVIAWHISNEYGGQCFCPLCEAAFREFLKKRYDNDIDKLNHEYWAHFWSHTYNSFDEIHFPTQHSERSLLGLFLDYRRFVSHQTTDFMTEEINAVRSVCPDLPVTTNMMPGFYELNYYEMAEKLDIISWDSYPRFHNEKHLENAYGTAFWHDAFRSMKQRPFLLMESAPGLVNWHPYNKLKRPGMDRLASIQAIAHGSDSVQYFQWRKGRGGIEKFHGAVVDHVGTNNTRVFKAVQSTGATLKKIDEVCGSMPEVQVAIIYDWENKWALMEAQGFALKEKKYNRTCVAMYKPLWERGISVDVINAHADLSKYDLVIAPMLYMTDQQTIDNITEYVKNGGTCYATYMLGMVNQSDLCYLGGFPAKNLKEVFGIWNEEIDTLYPSETTTIKFNNKDYTGKDYSELIHTNTAEVLAVYQTEFYAGLPALTVNNYGKGKAYYQAFRDTGSFWNDVLEMILDELNIKPNLPDILPEGVTSHKRVADGITYLFVENYSENRVENIFLGDTYTDMESDEKTDYISLDAYDIKILKK